MFLFPLLPHHLQRQPHGYVTLGGISQSPLLPQPDIYRQTPSSCATYRTAIRSKSKKIELVSSSQHAPETQRQFVMHLLLSLLRIAHTVGASNLWSVKAHLVICLISEESLFKILLSHLNCQQSLFQETGFSAFCKQSMAIASSSAVWKHSSWGKGGVIHLCDVQRASRNGRLTTPPHFTFFKCQMCLFLVQTVQWNTVHYSRSRGVHPVYISCHNSLEEF